MRALLSTPILLSLSTAAGFAVCRIIGADAHLREASYAVAVVILATAAGAVPLLLSKNADQATMAQAGLVATAVHMFVAIVLAGIVILVIKLSQPFIYWLFASYWITLIVVALESVRLVKSAPSTKTAPKH